MIDDSFLPCEVISRQQIIPRPASIVSLGYNQSVNLNGRKSVPAKFSYFLRKDFFLSWDDIMKKGFLFVLLVCFYHVDGGVMTNYDPNKTEEKQEKIGLMSNFQLKLKGTEKRNGGTITKFEVKLKDSGDDGKEPNFQLSLKDNENENENIE